MTGVEIVFWLSVVVLFFCYAGYGLLLFVFNKIKGLFVSKPGPSETELPPVTLIVAAFNERAVLEEKIRNSYAIDYPNLNLIFITDGSTDGSDEIILSYPQIKLLHQHERRGKMAAIKRAVQHVTTPIVIFSDANSLLNKECIRKMINHYSDPAVGGVAGEKKIRDPRQVSALGEAEGLYWKYESFLKMQDSNFYSVVGAAGELFSIRTSLFSNLDDSIILDDFLVSMQVCLQGYKIKYEPGAYAVESPSASLPEEEKRKVRISAGAYQSVGYLTACLNLFKYPILGFQYISRRLLRWVFCPPLILLLLFTNVILVNEKPLLFYQVMLYLQLFFYAMIIPGWLLVRSGRKAGILSVPFYFAFMNYCLVKGFFRFIQGKQSVLWEKSLRQAAG